MPSRLQNVHDATSGAVGGTGVEGVGTGGGLGKFEVEGVCCGGAGAVGGTEVEGVGCGGGLGKFEVEGVGSGGVVGTAVSGSVPAVVGGGGVTR